MPTPANHRAYREQRRKSAGGRYGGPAVNCRASKARVDGLIAMGSDRVSMTEYNVIDSNILGPDLSENRAPLFRIRL